MEKMMEKRNVATDRRNVSTDAEETALKAVSDAFDTADRIHKDIKKASGASDEAIMADEAADSDTLH